MDYNKIGLPLTIEEREGGYCIIADGRKVYDRDKGCFKTLGTNGANNVRLYTDMTMCFNKLVSLSSRIFIAMIAVEERKMTSAIYGKLEIDG